MVGDIRRDAGEMSQGEAVKAGRGEAIALVWKGS